MTKRIWILVQYREVDKAPSYEIQGAFTSKRLALANAEPDWGIGSVPLNDLLPAEKTTWPDFEWLGEP